MKDDTPALPANRYCERLGIPVPDLETALRYPTLGIADLMALAVLEAGRPLSPEAIAARLARLDLPPRFAHAADPTALRKAWRGQGALYRDPADGLFYPDLLHDQIGHLAFVGDPRRQAAVSREPTAIRQPPETEPLSHEEVDAAFQGRHFSPYSSSVSALRRAAAILDAAGGGPLALDEVNGRLARFGEPARLDETAIKAWRSGPVRLDDDGSLRLDASSPDTRAMRRDIRRLALPKLRERAWSAGFHATQAELEAQHAARDRQYMDEARRARRVLLHVVVLDGVPRAAAVIDAARRELRSFIGAAVADVAAHLEPFDFLAGLDIRASLRALGLDLDRWWLAELRPQQRTFRPVEKGRPLAADPSAIVQATTGRRGVPAPEEWKALLDRPSASRLEARLALEAEALFALYEYGALHGGVRVRKRKGDALLPVRWSMRGDPDFWCFLDASFRHLVRVHVVVGYPASLAEEPFKDAVELTIVERERDGRTLYARAGEDDVRVLDRADISAIALPATATRAIDSLRPPRSYRDENRACRLVVTLEGIAPPVWRRLKVDAGLTMEKLHEVIQAGFGWTNSHLHVFEVGDERIGVPYELEAIATGLVTRSGRIVRLADVIDLGFSRFTYEYDFGDSWRHTIEVEEVRPHQDEDDEGDAWARCLGGARACPPEDCGGVDGYARLLEILFDPRHPEFEDTRRWAGGFEPDRFDVRAANEAIARVRRY